MKSVCTTGLILLVSLSWATIPAHAQSGDGFGTLSLFPLPKVDATLPNAAITGDNGGAPELYGSAFVTRSREPVAPAPNVEKPLPSSTTESVPSCDWNDCDSSKSCCRRLWFGTVGGLVMTRNRANPFWTTFETNNNVNQLMNTQNAEANWAGGGQVTIGRYWCCGTGLAFTYWGLGPMTGTASITDPNNLLSTPINLNTQADVVRLGDPVTGTPAAFYFDNSHEHRITRNDQIQNVEINVQQAALVNNGWMQLTGLAGFRYFRFDERLSFGAVSANQNFGDNGGADEAYLNFRTTNNLFGGQVGLIANIPLTQRLGLVVIPKCGVFGNQMINNAHLFSGDGLQSFNINSSKSDVSFLGEIDAGLHWAITQNFKAYFSYRVIGIANLALSDNQFLPFLADQQGFGQIKQNGGLILHGAFAGAAWTF